jgi:hypothetical protein
MGVYHNFSPEKIVKKYKPKYIIPLASEGLIWDDADAAELKLA